MARLVAGECEFAHERVVGLGGREARERVGFAARRDVQHHMARLVNHAARHVGKIVAPGRGRRTVQRHVRGQHPARAGI